MTAATVTTWTAMKRGALLRCPHCGGGKLFARYLKPVETCAQCGEPLGHIRADDGPAWLSILAVGHLVVPIVLAVETAVTWPMWVSMTLWPAVTLALTLAVLPSAKGVFIGAIWAMKAPGSEA